MRCHWLIATTAATTLALVAGCSEKEPKLSKRPPAQGQPEPMTFEDGTSGSEAPNAAAPAEGSSGATAGSAGGTGTTSAGQSTAQPAGDATTGSGPKRMDMPPEGGQRTYTIKEGDTLYSIAKRMLGDGQRWQQIVDANPDLEDPTKLRPGMEIVIPAK